MVCVIPHIFCCVADLDLEIDDLFLHFYLDIQCAFASNSSNCTRRIEMGNGVEGDLKKH